MSYRHAHHAGNFADVLKHAVMTAILSRMLARPKPLCYIESHAGAGVYPLDAPAARQSRQAETGILRLVEAAPRSTALATYLQLIAALPENAAVLRAYPGSPLLAAGLLRDDDRLVLAELAPLEAEALRHLFRHDRRVAVHCRDGWEGLRALLPPTPRRGLLLLDPPYEAAADFRRVVDGLSLARRRWSVGVLAAWYPIKDRRTLRPFYAALSAAGLGALLCVELSVRPDDNPAGLNGSGMVIASPPFGLESELRALLDELASLVQQPDAPRPRVYWLAPPQSAPT
ncbi:MAG: 23S rRNA (adenine(2030)-N(6))-methyltransferase RlmJ [Gammaproteobacteria bacterium]